MAPPGPEAGKLSENPVTRRSKKVPSLLLATETSPEVMMPIVALDASFAPEMTDDKKKNGTFGDRVKPKKKKLVRESFTMPEQEYIALVETKKSVIKAGVKVKKSELLRIAIAQLNKMEIAQIQEALGTLTPVKAGRPSKDAS